MSEQSIHDSAATLALPDVAALSVQGERPSQQDAVRVEAHVDGSWMLAVADGTGFGPCPSEAAPTAVGALPERVSDNDGMVEAFLAADAAVAELYDGPRGPSCNLSHNPETTLAVAAWTPEGGLTAGWVGDTLIWLCRLRGSVVWWGDPTAMAGRVPLIGQFGTRERLAGRMRLLGGELPRRTTDALAAFGLIMLVMSDGAYAHPSMAAEHSLIFQLPDAARCSAQSAAQWVMDEAAADELHDNTTVAAVRIPPTARIGSIVA